MGNSKIVSISLPPKMVRDVEKIAREEHRTVSELFREALRTYQRERQGWKSLYSFGEKNAQRLGITTERQLNRMVDEVRHKQTKVSRKTGTK